MLVPGIVQHQRWSLWPELWHSFLDCSRRFWPVDQFPPISWEGFILFNSECICNHTHTYKYIYYIMYIYIYVYYTYINIHIHIIHIYRLHDIACKYYHGNHAIFFSPLRDVAHAIRQVHDWEPKDRNALPLRMHYLAARTGKKHWELFVR